MLAVYKLEQFYAENEMQDYLNCRETRFQTLRLSVREYRRDQVNDREISIDHKMYDVKSVKFSGDTVELLVLNDPREERILEKMNDFTHNGNPIDGDFLHPLKQLVFWNYLSDCRAYDSIIHSIAGNQYSLLKLHIIPVYLEIITPPPESV
jgi:hypothetical protein